MEKRQSVGIDVSKEQLDVASAPGGAFCQFSNDESGIEQLVEWLQGFSPVLTVLEATGGLEVPVAAALAIADLPVAIVSPRQVRDFAKATGQLAKSDKIDARVLANFARKVSPEPRHLPDQQSRHLSALLTRRRQIVGMVVAEKNRLSRVHPDVETSLERHLAWLNQELAGLDKELHDEVRHSPIWRE